jgi:hypothetical protein
MRRNEGNCRERNKRIVTNKYGGDEGTRKKTERQEITEKIKKT